MGDAQYSNSAPKTVQSYVAELPGNESAGINGVGGGELEIICGPLLNYKHLSDPESRPIWNGSVLIVTKPGRQNPQLLLREASSNTAEAAGRRFGGLRLYSNSSRTFWQFKIDVPLREQEVEWTYTLINARHFPTPRSTHSFYVPAARESMRIMFHSCNGFSVGTDEEAWSGPALWNDVLRRHKERPIHVMIGGGDQIYNDGVRVDGPLRTWTDIGNPVKRRDYPFPESLRSDCDDFYFNNYVRWYSMPPFSNANAQIAQVNIWDDHGRVVQVYQTTVSHYLQILSMDLDRTLITL